MFSYHQRHTFKMPLSETTTVIVAYFIEKKDLFNVVKISTEYDTVK